METAQFLSAQEVSEMWGITKRRVQNLCVSNRIPGAFRIGNMWAIPADAKKPKDARVRERVKEQIPVGVIIRKARRTLRTIVDSAVKEFRSVGLSDEDSLKVIVVLFASKLLEVIESDYTLCMSLCEKFFNYTIDIVVPEKITNNISQYISQYEMCLDDSLSWVYQSASKKSTDFKYNDTQFFTEKYMISTLVNSINIDSDSKVIDPACGGGNFLLYSFDKFSSQKPEMNAAERATYALSNLYGYEIDPFLAYVGAFNLKFKALTYVSKEMDVSVQDFDRFHPLVFYPKNDSVSGFLDIEWKKQFVINCDSRETIQLIDAFDGANVVVTNPPFRTIKGMPKEQKEYLRKFYPMSKCDMCNAFIERVMEVLPNSGKAAMVTQNSWMYLDSFTQLRKRLLTDYTINNIWELGSNAFYDLSGEKANVALITTTKKQPPKNHMIQLALLRNMGIEQIETALESKSVALQQIKQKDILTNTESRFDMVSTVHLRDILAKSAQYKDFAIPMQGTSTGDAKNLIDYYWRHIGDEKWVLVSKGGGYSRYEGLNSYCVKWGKDGEFIRNTKGSAIRNANYFNETQLVFSDTGTAGLNVRVLLPDQIFVASGPGIRITRGRRLSHLAFLNSRFAAFFVKLLTPKLTIAAGYIGKIPVTDTILDSSELEKYAEQCLKSKRSRLKRRANNYEFLYIRHCKGKSIYDVAKLWFLADLNDEWEQLQNEQKIEDFISKNMELTKEDQQAIDAYIGGRTIFSQKNETKCKITLSDVKGILACDCLPKRTKSSKKSLGSDGLIEYLSHIKGISCKSIIADIKKRFDLFADRYIDLYLHALVLSALRFRDKKMEQICIDALTIEMACVEGTDRQLAEEWIRERFNEVHYSMFEGKIIYYYDSENEIIKSAEE